MLALFVLAVLVLMVVLVLLVVYDNVVGVRVVSESGLVSIGIGNFVLS
jgi:hypothetical protein